MEKSKRICVIGAGASGLCSVRNIIKINEIISSTTLNDLIPVLYEKNDHVGGTWIYTDDALENVHSSMYKNLYTNLPKECMAFPDYPFPVSPNSYLHHTEVRQYLEGYTEQFNLKKYIQFRTEVQMIKPVTSIGCNTEDNGRWLVTTKNLDTRETETNEFSGIMVCNGHYSVPYYPIIPGVKDYFNGKIIHSHSYREPAPFKNKRVLVLGASNSGQDIGFEIAGVAKSVILSSNNPPLLSPLPKNVSQVLGVKSCSSDNSFVLMDGSQVTGVDILLLCTGYKYSYPFLHETCDISVVCNTMIKPLYKHTININHPTMCFIGTCSTINPFPQFNLQAQLFIRYVANLINMPTKDEMLRELNIELESMKRDGKPLRHFHKLALNQFAYNQDIAAMANVEDVPSYVEKLFYSVVQRRQEDVIGYKKDNYIWSEDENEYKIVEYKSKF